MPTVGSIHRLKDVIFLLLCNHKLLCFKLQSKEYFVNKVIDQINNNGGWLYCAKFSGNKNYII